jgi:MYXO-CTERM domain-containing protein
MTNGLFKKWFAASLCVVALASTAVLAEQDRFYLGDGHWGELLFSDPDADEEIVNDYALLRGITGRTLSVGTCRINHPCFEPNDLVMVFQTTGNGQPPADSGRDGGVVDIRNDPVGRWEFARVAAVSPTATGDSLTLTADLVNTYEGGLSQVIRVPEYTNVRVAGLSAAIIGAEWDGETGGVVAFLATGTVELSGRSISASGLGFWPGIYEAGQFPTTCSVLGMVGEGIHHPSYWWNVKPLWPVRGRDNVLNGGGGGEYRQSGGGGGANAGAGGKGGYSDVSSGSLDVGGRGGAPLKYELFNQMTFGGGGGAGNGCSIEPNITTNDGQGGGIVFIRARQLLSSGNITATGSLGASSTKDNGAGGGGAGGSIHLSFVEPSTCGMLSVAGGKGGTTSATNMGPGGGGGGGRIWLQAPDAGACAQTINIGGASPGGHDEPEPPTDGGTVDTSYGATRGTAGSVTIVSSALEIPPPVVTSPANGSVTNNPRPPFSGTSAPAVLVHVVIDGQERTPAVPVEAGTWNYTLPQDVSLPDGTHTVYAFATDLDGGMPSANGNTNTFRVDTMPPDTTITSGPSGAVKERTATFTFTSDDPAATFECRRENEAGFSSCTTPKTYTGLADGTYTFYVRARDAANNVDPSPASRTWTVDNTAPAAPVIITPANGATVYNNYRPSIKGTSVPGTTVNVIIDNAPAGTAPTDAAGQWSFVPTTDLTAGPHTVRATATDPAGNTSPPSATNSFTIVIDTTPPDTTITSGPSGAVKERTATFTFTSDDPAATFECRRENEADFSSCTTPKTYTGLADGTYTFYVRARDAANNVDPSPDSRTWTVDNTAPAAPVVITPADGAIVNTFRPPITGSSEPGTTVNVIIDNAPVGTAPTNAAGQWSFVPTTDLALGAHTVKATATDPAGNTSPESATNDFTIVIDTTPPDTTITSGPTGTVRERTATFTFTSDEPAATFECRMGPGSVATGDFATCTTPMTYTGLVDGTYTFEVRARDAANNVDPTPASRTWTVAQPPLQSNISFRGNGCGSCSATGADASLLVMALGSLVALVRRRTRR